MKKFLPILLALACIAVAPASAAAEALSDPTRPSGTVAGGAAVPGSEAPAAVPQLQSVIILPTERSAIINGQLLKLGAAFGELRVVKISENEVVLHSVDGNQTLRMYPEVFIKRIEAAPFVVKAPAPTIKKPARKKAAKAVNGKGTPK